MSNTTNFYFYWRGDRAAFTGNTKLLDGATCYEFRFLDGHRAGELGWTYKGPDDRTLIAA